VLFRSWGAFRGPTYDGHAPAGQWPTQWSRKVNKETKQETLSGVRWKSAIPKDGHSSPVVWDEKIFLTGGDATGREVYCFEAATGKLAWRTLVGPAKEVDEVYNGTGWAAPTMAVDGTLAYALFSSGELAALDFSGHVVWRKSFGFLKNQYGFTNSLAFYKDRLIVLLDVDGDEGSAKPALLALAPADGKELWKVERKEGGAWASPVIITTPKGDQLVTCAAPNVIAYQPSDGKELWRAKVLAGDVAASAVYAQGFVITANDRAKLAVTKADGQGTVAPAWSNDEEKFPDAASPLTDGQRIYLFNGEGKALCFSLTGGKKLWEHDFDSGFYASPVLAGEVIYATDRAGNTMLVKAGPQFEEAGVCPLGVSLNASPAFARGRIYFRSGRDLFAIGSQE